MSWFGLSDFQADLRAALDDVFDGLPDELTDQVTGALAVVETTAISGVEAAFDEGRDDGYEAGVESVDCACRDDEEHEDRIAQTIGSTEFLRFVLEVAKEAARKHDDLWSIQTAPANLVRQLRG